MQKQIHISLRLKKSHAVAFGLALSFLVAIVAVIGVAPAGVATHATLYTDTIAGKSANPVTFLAPVFLKNAGQNSKIEMRGGSDGTFSSSIYLYNPSNVLNTVISDGTYTTSFNTIGGVPALSIAPGGQVCVNYGAGCHGDPSYKFGVVGNAVVGGNIQSLSLSVNGAKQFQIDHPLDPEHKVLRHSTVESPEMKNFYDGIVTLDAKGESVVTLPSYFEALNTNFRYQLTALGNPAPGLYIKKEIKDGRFTVAGGSSGQRVSWMVTGVRHDSYALAHPMIVEEYK